MSKNLISELKDLLAAADQKIFELEDVVDEDIFSKLSGTLFNLNNKHIPPEICSEIKLMERIDEANNLLKEIEMTNKQNILEVDCETLRKCADGAILRWNAAEGTLAKELQEGCDIDYEFLTKFQQVWQLNRIFSTDYRAKVATFLRDRARPAIQAEKKNSLPALVEKLVLEMEEKVLPSKQTSLMSKFAFSLRPESLIPIDARAREGIKNLTNSKKIKADQYIIYIEKFDDYILTAVEQALERCQLFDKLSDSWTPTMSRELFIRRTADKVFMVLGGYDVENL